MGAWSRKLAVVLGVVSGTVISAVWPAGAKTSRSVTLASNKAAARVDAAKLLSEVVLPAGARRLAAEPSGDSGLLRPNPHLDLARIGVVDNVWWETRVSPERVIAVARGSRPPGTVSVGGMGDDQAIGEMFSLGDVPGVLDGREVDVTATVLADGETGVLVESQSVWVLPRALDSLIPHGVHRIDVIETTSSHKVVYSASVTSTSRVRATRSFFNTLEEVQPFLTACPVTTYSSTQRTITVRFVPSTGADPLATAVFTESWQGRGAGVSASACDPVQLRVGSAAPVPVLGGDYVSSLRRLLGVRI